MKKNIIEINRYLQSFTSGVENIKYRSSDVKGILDEFVKKQAHFLIKYSVESFTIDSDEFSPEECIYVSEHEVKYVTHKGGRYYDRDGETISPKDVDVFYYIKKDIRHLDPASISKGFFKRSPKESMFLMVLVIFVMLSPMYSNLFNSRLVYGESTSSLIFISCVFGVGFLLEYILKEIISKGVLRTIEKENLVAEAYLFEMVNNSENKDSVVHWQTATASLNVIWKQIGHIALELIVALSIALVMIYLLGFYSAFPLIAYVTFSALHLKFKLKSYRSILTLNQLSEQKLSYLVGMQNARKTFKYINFHKLRAKWDRLSFDISRFNFDIQNHDESSAGILKMFTSCSIIIIFVSSFFAINAGYLMQTSVIALMLLNGRITSAISSSINRIYHVVTSYSKLKGAINSLHEADFNLYNKGRISFSKEYKKQLLVDNIDVSFEGKDIISGLKIDLRSGDWLALTGKIGSGKSTLLKTISGALTPDSGKILLNKVAIHEYNNDFFIQCVAKYEPNDNFVSDSLYFNMELKYGQSPNEIMQSLKDFDCGFALNQETLYQIPADRLKLSTGQLQKLKMVQSLGKDPEIIIFDEPCSAMSNKESVSFLQSIKRKHPNAIVIISTHNPEIVRLSNYTLDMESKELCSVRPRSHKSLSGSKAVYIS